MGTTTAETSPRLKLDAAPRPRILDLFSCAGGAARGYQQAGFYVVGGTSVSAPIIAGVYALAGNASTITYAKLAYTNKSHLFDVKSGANGVCGGSYLCTALAGYDGPTGNGTPNGIAAF